MADALADMPRHEVPHGTDLARAGAYYSRHRWLRCPQFSQIKLKEKLQWLF